jgi:hypothetical protein
MTITRAIAAAMLAGLAVGAASTAWADPPTMNGHYVRIVTNAKGQAVTNDWYFTPCGEGCAQLTTPRLPRHGWSTANGQWTSYPTQFVPTALQFPPPAVRTTCGTQTPSQARCKSPSTCQPAAKR